MVAQAESPRTALRQEGGATRLYLTCVLAGARYLVPASAVREVEEVGAITPVPATPAWLRGVMNLRGAIVPVVDLRLRFGLESVEYTKITVVIVVTVRSEPHGDRIIGMVVDGVSDVLNINNAADIKDAPDFGTAVHTEFISGLVAVDSGMVMLLDVDRLLSVEEMFALEGLRGTESRHIVAHAS